MRGLLFGVVALTACGSPNSVSGQVQGYGTFRANSAIMQFGSMWLLEEHAEPRCGKTLLEFNRPDRGLIILRLGPAGQRIEVQPDQALRAGQGSPAATSAMYFLDRLSESEWSGWVQTDERIASGARGSFDLTAGDSHITGTFDAVGCP
ncbi:MAG: hypothetical protein JNK82_18870 [Myxococcaceae bacterium]|nr:hypothetical protein [Myxococcaceae bacterium]